MKPYKFEIGQEVYCRVRNRKLVYQTDFNLGKSSFSKFKIIGRSTGEGKNFYALAMNGGKYDIGNQIYLSREQRFLYPKDYGLTDNDSFDVAEEKALRGIECENCTGYWLCSA